MPTTQNEIFWLTTYVIENDLLKKTTWTKGWAALEVFANQCDQPQCTFCQAYQSVLEQEQILVEMMYQEALYTERKYRHHPVFLAGDYYQHWVEEYRLTPNKQNGDPRVKGIVSIEKRAKNLKYLERLLKKFAKERSTNLFKQVKVHSPLEMDAMLNSALQQESTDPENKLDEGKLWKQFIQNGILLSKQAMFAFIVLIHPEELLKYPELIYEISKPQVTKATLATLEHLINDYEDKKLKKTQFHQAINELFGLGKNDIYNWSRKNIFTEYLNEWRKRLGG